MNTIKPAPFALDPALPWLRTDPKMQQHEAFIGVRTIKLNKAGWAPMGLYFPGGATLLAVQINKMEDLTPGVYWHEHRPSNPAAFAGSLTDGVIYHFGRFEGFGELSRSQVRRYKQGQAHIDLGSDTLDCDLRQHWLREDGTSTVFVNFGAETGSGEHRIWRITHYVDMSFSLLESLGEATYNASGMTEEQERWLKEENELRTADHCSEYSAYTLGDFPEASCRAVLHGEVNGCFGQLFGELPTITPSQAKKRKSGAVAISWRSYSYDGNPVGYTQYYKLEVARVMLDLLQSHTEIARATSRLNAATTALLGASADLDEAQQEAMWIKEPEARHELAHAA